VEGVRKEKGRGVVKTKRMMQLQQVIGKASSSAKIVYAYLYCCKEGRTGELVTDEGDIVTASIVAGATQQCIRTVEDALRELRRMRFVERRGFGKGVNYLIVRDTGGEDV